MKKQIKYLIIGSVVAAFILLVFLYGAQGLGFLVLFSISRFILWAVWIESSRYSAMTLKQKHDYKKSLNETIIYGGNNPEIFCPQCKKKGNVHTRVIRKKNGISGGKATAAMITGGLSLLAVGLSKKVATTDAYCINCRSKWSF